MIKESLEYNFISREYGDRVAKRSGVLLINHINEGLVVLDAIGATEEAKRAFCLHPLFQADADLEENCYRSKFIDPYIMLLAMEYRSVANEFLSDKIGTGQKIRLSPLKEVNDMLIADKVQNYKDFLTYHKDTHNRSCDLDLYFNAWLHTLGIDREQYNSLCDAIEGIKV